MTPLGPIHSGISRIDMSKRWIFWLSLLVTVFPATGHAACSWTTLYNNTTADAVQVMNNFDCVEPIRSVSGNVGIGTASPARRLVISSGGNQGFEFGPGEESSVNYIVNYNRGTDAYVTQRTYASSYQFYNVGTPVLAIDPSGNVGIGTNFPSLGRLQIEGSGNQVLSIHSTNDDATIRLYYDNVMRWRIYNNPGSGSDLIILDAGQDNGVVLYQNANSWASVSDARLKRNVRTLPVLARLTSYRAVSYDWRSNGQHDIGVIAQELNKSFPELVRRGNSGPRKSYRLDQGGTWSVDYAKLGAVALAGVKELDAKLFSVRTAQQEELIQLRRLVQSQAVELRKMQDRLARLETGKLRTASR